MKYRRQNVCMCIYVYVCMHVTPTSLAPFSGPSQIRDCPSPQQTLNVGLPFFSFCDLNIVPVDRTGTYVHGVCMYCVCVYVRGHQLVFRPHQLFVLGFPCHTPLPTGYPGFI